MLTSCGDDVVKFIDNEYLYYDEANSTTSNTMLKLDTGHSYRWDAHDANRMTFFALFPSKKDLRNLYSEDDSSIGSTDYSNMNSQNSVTMTNSEQRFKYYMASKPQNQIDVLYAQASCAGNYANTVNFGMKHILTGLNVSLGDGFDTSKEYISSITIGSINAWGWFNMATGEWETLSGGNKHTRSLTYTYTEGDEDNLDNTMFMVIPQGLGASAGGIVGNCNMTIIVHNKETNTDETFTKSLNGTSWPMGKTVKYQLSVTRGRSEYYIATEYTTMKYGWDGNPAGNETPFTETTSGTTVTKVNDLGNIRVKSYKVVITESSTGGTPDYDYEEVAWTPVAYTVDSNGYKTETVASDITFSEITEASGVDVNDYRSYSSTEDDYIFKSQNYNYLFKATMTKQNYTETPSDDYTKITTINNGIFFGTQSSPIDLTQYKQQYKLTSSTTATPYNWYINNTSGDVSSNYTRYSSNCYMIQYPGYYTIPCVYGNAIYQNEAKSDTYILGTSVYSPNSYTRTNCIGTLKNFKNLDIGSAWLSNGDGSGETPAQAALVWQDVDGLIETTSVKYRKSGGEYYIDFKVSQTAIEPGNAVIAIMNSSNTVLWSWHIWVTPYAANDVYNIDANKLGTAGAQKYLKVPLGYVLNSTKTWPERKYVVRLTQNTGSGTPKYTDVTLWQEKHELPRMSCCYYQWGRKDPFPGITVDEVDGAMNYDGSYQTTQTRRPIYSGIGLTEIVKTTNSSTTLGGGISSPWAYVTKHTYTDGTTSNRFPDTNYYDLWGTLSDYSEGDKYPNVFPTGIGVTSRKTVYDPCPPGFKVPPVYSMPAITWSGANVSSVRSDWVDNPTTEAEVYNKYVNTPFTSHTEFVNTVGYTFYCAAMSGESSKNPSSGTYNLHAFGNINTDGEFEGYGVNARYWTASRWCSSYGDGTTNHRMFSLYISYGDGASSFHPTFGNTESYGCPVFAIFDTQRPAY